MCSDDFAVAVLRPPMVYGKGCKGNFQSVIKLVKKLPFFPRVKNKRSMIYIDNLSAYVKCVIDSGYQGLLFPQNAEFGETTKMAKIIAKTLGKRLYASCLLGVGVKIFSFVGTIKKAFGSLVYDIDEKNCKPETLVPFEDSIALSV